MSIFDECSNADGAMIDWYVREWVKHQTAESLQCSPVGGMTAQKAITHPRAWESTLERLYVCYGREGWWLRGVLVGAVSCPDWVRWALSWIALTRLAYWCWRGWAGYYVKPGVVVPVIQARTGMAIFIAPQLLTCCHIRTCSQPCVTSARRGSRRYCGLLPGAGFWGERRNRGREFGSPSAVLATVVR